MTDNPGFAHIDENGALLALVFDDSGLPEDHQVVALPEDYWTRLYRWDAEGGAFVPDIEGSRAALWEAVKAKRFAVELGGCETPLGRMDSDEVSQQKLIGAVTMAMLAAQGGSPFSVDWTMADNSTSPTTARDHRRRHGDGHLRRHRPRRRDRAAGRDRRGDSFEDLDAIDIEAAPWPGEGQE
jgi:hypothetical protein